MDQALPIKCFLSHAYADVAQCDQLIRILPRNVKAVVFPPITVKPDQFVSTQLITAILDCDGLVYLRGGRSAQSFWVAFERDYALRAGKQVFAADPATLDVVRDTEAPLDLAAFASYHHGDAPRVREIVEYMKHERYFDLWLDVEDIGAGADWRKAISESLTDRLKRGGYEVVFWSRRASESQEVRKEIKMAIKSTVNFNDRVLFALLDECPIPEFWTQYQEPSVQLYGDTKRPAAHRWDDLVVRLYWLIYRKTRAAEWK